MTPAIDKELQEYYEARFSMTSSKGWNDLLEDIELMIKDYSDISKIDSVDKLYKRQGQLDILNWIKSLREISERTYEELNEETV